MALAALTTGKRTAAWGMHDPGFFTLGHTFRDDKPGGHGWVDMQASIVQSCDTYYYALARDMGVNAIHDFMKPLGFGQITGIDIEGESRGILPSTEWKRKAYRKPEQQKWYDGETISLGIGQGYNSFTILQLANAVSILVNNGVAMKPHLVKAVEDSVTRKRSLTVPKESYRSAQAGRYRRDQARHGGVTQPARRRACSPARLRVGGQDRYGADLHAGQEREVQPPRDRRTQARPLAVHGLRAGRSSEDRAGADRRERRLWRRRGRADRAQGDGLLPDRQVARRTAGDGAARGRARSRRRQAARGPPSVFATGLTANAASATVMQTAPATVAEAAAGASAVAAASSAAASSSAAVPAARRDRTRSRRSIPPRSPPHRPGDAGRACCRRWGTASRPRRQRACRAPTRRLRPRPSARASRPNPSTLPRPCGRNRTSE
jgi:penicillin-binding protein 2